MISSTMPSAKYSCSGSPLILSKGNTAIDGLSGREELELSGAIDEATAAAAPESACAPASAGRTRISPVNC